MDFPTFQRSMTDVLVELDPENERHRTAALGPDDNLFDEGFVTSFTVLRMLPHLERMAGRTIDVADHDIESFATLRGLYGVVTGPGAPGAR